MERLAIRGEDSLDSGERDYLDGLDQFITTYDQQALSNHPRRGTPAASAIADGRFRHHAARSGKDSELRSFACAGRQAGIEQGQHPGDSATF